MMSGPYGWRLSSWGLADDGSVKRGAHGESAGNVPSDSSAARAPDRLDDRAAGGRGQSSVELAVTLPVLIMLMVLVAESGFLLRNYLLVSTANREAARLAARGRYDDQRVGERAVAAGGIVTLGGTEVPYLRTHGTEPNTGLIVTHLPMDTSGSVISVTTWVSGVIGSPSGSLRAVQPAGPSGLSSDSRVDRPDIEARHGATTQSVNNLRQGAQFEPTENHIVVVETFFVHDPLVLTSLFPVQAAIPVYAQTTVRVTEGYAGEPR